MDVEQNFKVKITRKLNEKLIWLVKNYEKEISAWLTGEIKDGEIIIEDFLVPHQEVTVGSVDTTGKNLIDLRKEYGDKCKKIIGHFHSHNTMSSSWSPTDDDFIKTFIAPREVAVFIVSSINDGHRVRVELNRPIKLSLDEAEFEIIYEDDKLEKELRKIIKDKIEVPKPIKTTIDYGPPTYQKQWDSMNTQILPEEIADMIYLDSPNKEVAVRYLNQKQVGEIKKVFDYPATEYIKPNSLITLVFKVKKKKKLKQLADDLRDFLVEEFTKQIDEYPGYVK